MEYVGHSQCTSTLCLWTLYTCCVRIDCSGCFFNIYHTYLGMCNIPSHSPPDGVGGNAVQDTGLEPNFFQSVSQHRQSCGLFQHRRAPVLGGLTKYGCSGCTHCKVRSSCLLYYGDIHQANSKCKNHKELDHTHVVLAGALKGVDNFYIILNYEASGRRQE